MDSKKDSKMMKMNSEDVSEDCKDVSKVSKVSYQKTSKTNDSNDSDKKTSETNESEKIGGTDASEKACDEKENLEKCDKLEAKECKKCAQRALQSRPRTRTKVNDEDRLQMIIHVAKKIRLAKVYNTALKDTSLESFWTDFYKSGSDIKFNTLYTHFTRIVRPAPYSCTTSNCAEILVVGAYARIPMEEGRKKLFEQESGIQINLNEHGIPESWVYPSGEVEMGYYFSPPKFSNRLEKKKSEKKKEGIEKKKEEKVKDDQVQKVHEMLDSKETKDGLDAEEKEKEKTEQQKEEDEFWKYVL